MKVKKLFEEVLEEDKENEESENKIDKLKKEINYYKQKKEEIKKSFQDSVKNAGNGFNYSAAKYNANSLIKNYNKYIRQTQEELKALRNKKSTKEDN